METPFTANSLHSLFPQNSAFWGYVLLRFVLLSRQLPGPHLRPPFSLWRAPGARGKDNYPKGGPRDQVTAEWQPQGGVTRELGPEGLR